MDSPHHGAAHGLLPATVPSLPQWTMSPQIIKSQNKYFLPRLLTAAVHGEFLTSRMSLERP